MPDYLRRRLLTAFALSPLLTTFSSRAASPDLQRIIALEWLPVELLLALGIRPYGVADLHNYNVWVGKPALPAGVIDVGLRTEPNLELMSQMQPSLILYSNGYGPNPAQLQRIAPVEGFDLNDGSGHPLATARQSLHRLASLLGREAQAEQHLQAFDAEVAAARQRLAPFAQRPLLLMSLMDSRHAIVFGKSSLFLDVMQLLGLENAWQGETNFWGSAVIGIERLATIEHAQAICFDHDNAEMLQQVQSSPLWQSLPFIQQQRFISVPAVWYYGATLSALQFVRVLLRALEGK
ncbi:Fe(3+)-hydroxamate ABC transporter substrate-binding protein FhuD [Pantoea sp. A4]|uniref:Fe(3+)-hydroxamate ABC transporter substrate-binding protein FhuD n=1 Tax=Pantoea sp. A4 TaxID=1225184 RepID=UPI00037F5BD3|nr:Fe(3+)-hydroxamate ABC transporter substrate-binding protein FhuD [Pantoea sp. A4]